VQRPFVGAVIDEVDSTLIDEARIPLILAGGESDGDPLVNRVDQVMHQFRRAVHYVVDESAQNVALTDQGIELVEAIFNCANLFSEDNLPLLSLVKDSLYAYALLRRDVQYVVKDGRIEAIDEFKGRIAKQRKWPAGIQCALEAKEKLANGRQGRILASMTLQNLVALYPKVAGMTGTAATQKEEFRSIYGLDVTVIPPQ
jgi:preprotein translocase subunit SecA